MNLTTDCSSGIVVTGITGAVTNVYDQSKSYYKPMTSLTMIVHHNIEKVIFNPPATIVLWDDKTKTVVKCKDGDQYDKWTGLALCIAKRYLGNNFHSTFRKWCKDND